MTGDRNPYDPLPGEYATGGPIDPSMAVPGLTPQASAPADDPWNSGGPAPGGVSAGQYGQVNVDPVGPQGIPGTGGGVGNLMSPSPGPNPRPEPADYDPHDPHDPRNSGSGITRGARSLDGKPITAAAGKPPIPASALVVPPVMLMAGGGGAAYLGEVVGSWPLGGLAGALGLVGALFSYVMLRG